MARELLCIERIISCLRDIVLNCLIIADTPEANKDLELFLQTQSIECEQVYDVFTGFQRVQQRHYDIVFLDTVLDSLQIKQTIQVIKGSNPDAKIIVQTRNNSRDLEAAIRKEQIFYYHIQSFGIEDLTTAIRSALEHVRV